MDLYGLQPITGFFFEFLFYSILRWTVSIFKAAKIELIWQKWLICLHFDRCIILNTIKYIFFYLCAINQLDLVSVAHLLNISKYWINLVNKPLFNCMGNTKEATSCFAVTLNTGKQILKTSNSIIIYKHLNNNKQLSPFEFCHYIGNATHINQWLRLLQQILFLSMISHSFFDIG